MPNVGRQNAILRPELDLFYVLDTSGSMRGEPITRLNRAMVETIDTMRMEAQHNRDARVKIAVLEFNSTCRWVQPRGPEDMDVFFWDDLTAGGNTFVGSALKELNSKLTDAPGGFINSQSGSLMPVIIFMTDGYANDDYASSLQKILQNKWFSRATRVGFAIGKNPDTQMIAKLAGSSEAVIRTEDLGLFAELLRWVSLTSSVMSSKTRTSGASNIGSAAVREAARSAGYDPDFVTPDFSYDEGFVDGGNWGPGSPFVDSNDYDSSNPF